MKPSTYQSNAYQAPLDPHPKAGKPTLDEWLKEQGRRQTLERLDKQMMDMQARQDKQANWLLFFILLHVTHLIIALMRFI